MPTPTKAPKKTAVKEVPDANLVDDKAAEELITEAEEAMEILEPLVEAKRWVVGKPPEEGGKSTEFSVYTQQPLGYMARNRMFSLIGRTMSAAIKATGGSVGGMEDVFGAGGGTLIERGRRLGARDFQDASQFFTLAMELVGYVPDFLSDFYSIALEVPVGGERAWFREVIEIPYRPDQDQWGMSEDMGIEIIEIFIDQNYEDIRRFFIERLPRIGRRAAQREQDHKTSHESASPQSKSSRKSGQVEVATS
jgi:hypothetical protein